MPEITVNYCLLRNGVCKRPWFLQYKCGLFCPFALDAAMCRLAGSTDLLQGRTAKIELPLFNPRLFATLVLHGAEYDVNVTNGILTCYRRKPQPSAFR